MVALVIGLIGGTPSASAQEENLELALRDQNRRIEGLTALTTRIRNLMAQYLPEGWIETEEEAEPAVPDSSPKVEVREVTLVMNDGAARSGTVATTGTAGDLAAPDAETYRQRLQAAATKLNISGSFPKRKEIMIGARNLGIGEAIAIAYQDQRYDLEILDITSSELKLRDQGSGLELKVAIGMTLALPPGMSRTPPPMSFFQSEKSDPAPAARPDAPASGQ